MSILGDGPLGDLPLNDAPTVDLVPTMERWYRPLETPIRYPLALRPNNQQFEALVKAEPFGKDSVARWMPPLGAPLRYPQRILAGQQRFNLWSEWPIVYLSWPVQMLGEGSMPNAPSTGREEQLRDPDAQIVYAAELHPWYLTDR